MADNEQVNPDGLAKKWFFLAVIGTVLYVSAVFSFVITPEVGPKEVPVDGEVAEHGQHH